jgi:hypothetical protein
MKVLVVGNELSQLVKAAQTMTGVECCMMTQPEWRTRKQLRPFTAVVVVVPEQDVAAQELWQNWLKKCVFGNGLAVNWATYKDE